MSAVRWIAPVSISLLLGGCGFFVPELQESLTHGGTPSEQEGLAGEQFVDSIVFNVTCEVRDAIVQLYQNYPDGAFMNTWGVQVTLNLQVEEKTSANPTGNWTPPSPTSSLFNLGFGATATGDATRIDKINWFLPIQQFKGKPVCGDQRPQGVFLLESDLRLKEWLYDAITATKTRNVDFSNDTPDGPFKQNVLSHEVKFEVLTNGNAVPGWKLTRVTINQTGTGLTASRDRTHDLTITLGPATATKVPVTDSTASKSWMQKDVRVI